MIAGEHAEAAGVNGQRFVQAELGGEICDGPRPQDAGIGRAPGAVGKQIFLLAAIDVVDAAMQHQFRGAALQLAQGNFTEHGDGILVELPPALGVEIAKEADAVRIPAPPEIAGQRPEPLLRRAR